MQLWAWNKGQLACWSLIKNASSIAFSKFQLVENPQLIHQKYYVQAVRKHMASWNRYVLQISLGLLKRVLSENKWKRWRRRGGKPIQMQWWWWKEINKNVVVVVVVEGKQWKCSCSGSGGRKILEMWPWWRGTIETWWWCHGLPRLCDSTTVRFR